MERNDGEAAVEFGADVVYRLLGRTDPNPLFTAIDVIRAPVLGVPMPSKYLRGEDSLLSIVQMPKGVPVATFAIGEAGAANAAQGRVLNKRI